MDDVAANAPADLYERDFYAWTREQAALLKQGRVREVDVSNLEEIETLGRKEISELRSRYMILAQHLLKQMYQPGKATRSWQTTILDQRIQVARHMLDNPSLKPEAAALFLEADADARALAASETGLPRATFPDEPPFTRHQAVDRSFSPGIPEI